MIRAGIDAGVKRMKTVILDDRKLLASVVIDLNRESTLDAARKTLDLAATQAGIRVDEIGLIAVTGMGRKHIDFAVTRVSDVISLVTGISWLIPSTRIVLDVGAQKSLAVKCRDGVPYKSRANDRCASGSGRFLDAVAEILNVSIEQMPELALHSNETLQIQNTCTVFAESEIITLVHMKKRTEDIVKAALKGLAQRVFTLLIDLGLENDISLAGGVAKNAGFIKELSELAGCDLLVPPDPDIVSAAGAALAARTDGGD